MARAVHLKECYINMYFVTVALILLKHLICGLGEGPSNYIKSIHSSSKSIAVHDDNSYKLRVEKLSKHETMRKSNKIKRNSQMLPIMFQYLVKKPSISFTENNGSFSSKSIIKGKSEDYSRTLEHNCNRTVCSNPSRIGIEKSLLIPIEPAVRFHHAAVATDNDLCSDIGRDILRMGGSAVDTAIAALLCLGTVHFQSSGIGGSGSMIVYKKDANKVDGFDFSDMAPGAIDEDTFEDARASSINGGLAVGVPGELRGFQAAWKSYGKLSWKTLVQPSVDLAHNGFPITKDLAAKIKRNYDRPFVFLDPGLRELLTYNNGTAKEEGTILKRPLFARTLEIIRDNPDDFYEGNLARKIIEDIQMRGGVMNLDDLKAYRVKKREPIAMKSGNISVYTTYNDGGPILLHILNINKGYNFSASDVDSVEKQILTYHRIIESFKFSYAYRPYLGDPDDATHKEEINTVIQELLDSKIAEEHRLLINDSHTQDPPYYGKIFEESNEQGTTHVSVLAENGDAVSCTSSVNYQFGAKFLSKTTGMIFNNVMVDFTMNLYLENENITLPKVNVPGPRKRPRSSKAPTIVIDDDGNVNMVIGTSGGDRIPLTTALEVSVGLIKSKLPYMASTCCCDQIWPVWHLQKKSKAFAVFF